MSLVKGVELCSRSLEIYLVSTMIASQSLKFLFTPTMRTSRVPLDGPIANSKVDAKRKPMRKLLISKFS